MLRIPLAMVTRGGNSPEVGEFRDAKKGEDFAILVKVVPVV